MNLDPSAIKAIHQLEQTQAKFRDYLQGLVTPETLKVFTAYMLALRTIAMGEDKDDAMMGFMKKKILNDENMAAITMCCAYFGFATAMEGKLFYTEPEFER